MRSALSCLNMFRTEMWCIVKGISVSMFGLLVSEYLGIMC